MGGRGIGERHSLDISKPQCDVPSCTITLMCTHLHTRPPHRQSSRVQSSNPIKTEYIFFFFSFFFVHSFTSVPTFFHSHFISTNHIYFPILFNKSSEVNAFVVSFTVLIISVFLSGDPQHRIPSCFSCVIDSNFIQKTFWLY